MWSALGLDWGRGRAEDGQRLVMVTEMRTTEKSGEDEIVGAESPIWKTVCVDLGLWVLYT